MRHKYPFIYFFMEPNIVFSYKIDSSKYLTLSDLTKSNQWETYEMNEGETFQQFDHRNYKKLEGKSYFLRQDDLIPMVEEINKYIQIHRITYEAETTPVHIVSPEYAAGSLRVGLERPKQVIGIPDFFSIGPLWRLDEKIGQTFRNEWIHENINFIEEDDVYQNKFANTLREIEEIPSTAPIYVWFGNNADEQIGLRFILNLLKNKKNGVFLINSTELYKKYISSEDSAGYTGQLEPEILLALFEKSKPIVPLSNTAKSDYLKEWQSLSESKDTLRIWINDKIEAVPEDYYDELIIKTTSNLHLKQETKDFITTNDVIGELITETDGAVGWFFLEYRIRHLVYNGVFELKGIPKSMRHYSVKIRERHKEL